MYQTLIFWQDVANSKDATLKNPFASLLAEFDTTLKLELQVNDILFPLSFDLDQIGIFLAFHSLPLTRGPREEKRFKGAMSPNTHARANENKLEKDSPTFSSCVGDFGRLFLSV